MQSSGIQKSVGLGEPISQLNDVQYAKVVARRIFDIYDKDKNGIIDPYESSPMLQDTYLNMNRSITPTKYDIDSYQKILDQNGDGRATYADFEALIIKYLCGAKETNRFGPKDSRYAENLTMAALRNESVTRAGTYSREQPKTSTQEELGNKGFVHRQLEQARRIFRKYDRDNSGFIDEDELVPMLEDTYKSIGAERKITKEDVTSYLGMVDSNRDGKISLMEFETIVIKALERVGISFD